MKCPYCAVGMFYFGITDGGGDYGEVLCDEYECPSCGHIEERNCVEGADEGDPEYSWIDF